MPWQVRGYTRRRRQRRLLALGAAGLGVAAFALLLQVVAGAG